MKLSDSTTPFKMPFTILQKKKKIEITFDQTYSF